MRRPDTTSERTQGDMVRGPAGVRAAWRQVLIFVLAMTTTAALGAGCSDETSNTNGQTDTGGSDGGGDGNTDGATGDASSDGSGDGSGGDTDDGDATSGDTAMDVTDSQSPGDTATDVGDTSGFDIPDISRTDYCMGDGPPILVSDSGGTTSTVCTGDIAQVTFRYALCTCSDLALTDMVTTDAFDSSVGPYMPGGVGGAVGSNGTISAQGVFDVGGSLWSGAAGGMNLTNVVGVAQELHDNGPLVGQGDWTIDGDARVNGDIDAGELTVGGTLTLPSGATIMASNSNVANEVRAPVSVPPPCDCAPEQLVDIAGFVGYHATNNDNDDIGLDPGALDGVDTETTVELDCGRFYLDAIRNTAPVTIRANDRTALFVGGDIENTSELTIELAEGAELDLFVAGGMITSDQVNFGSIDNPAAVRLYLGTDGTIVWDNKISVGGNVYAPFATLQTGDKIEIFGSLFLDTLDATNEVTIHYDRAVLTAGETCEDPDPDPDPDPDASSDMDSTIGTDMDTPPETCTDCRDCGNQACNDGVCGGCASSADCCSPLICVENRCQIIN